jgi:phosphatidylglycerophosphate synthase
MSASMPIDALRRDSAWKIAIVGAHVAGLAASPLMTSAQGIATLVVFTVGAALAWRGLEVHRPLLVFGAANTITATRMAIASVLAGMALGPIGVEVAWLLAGLGLLALASDGIDGYLARKQATASPFGARFDMEVDAFLALALCALLVATGRVGTWILALGALRYAFIAAGLVVPAMRAALPPSSRRRAICAVQIAVLAIAVVPAVPPPIATWIAATALATTLYSFAVDTILLLRSSPSSRSKPCAIA